MSLEPAGLADSRRPPAFVMQVGSTDIAVEPEIAADMFVLPA